MQPGPASFPFASTTSSATASTRDRRFKPRTVTLVDQFGRSKAVASQLTTLCAPVRKNGSTVRNARAHLVCYPIKRKPAFRSRKVVITNQFEKGTRLVVVRPVQLCVPSGKAVLPGPSPQPVKGLDHYQCYVVKPARKLRERRVSLLDQFGKSRPTVVRMVSLCAPVRKNTVPVRNKRDHLVCYQLRSTQAFRSSPRGDREPVRQRGSDRRLAADALPAIAEAPERAARPDRLDPEHPHPGELPRRWRYLHHHTRFHCHQCELGERADAVYGSEYRPIRGRRRRSTVPSLAAGASVPLTANLGPDNNCYDPDCTVSVTVDSSSAVAEANEMNNTATRTDPG